MSDTPGPADPARVLALAADVVARLGAAGDTLAVAESLTGGLVTARLIDIAGASRVLRGGITAYASDLKASLLGVPAALLAERGPVDPDVAAAMARGAAARLACDWAVATTGVAGPGPQAGRPAGTVHVAACGPAGVLLVASHRFAGGRSAVRSAAVEAALEVLLSAYTAARPGPPGTPGAGPQFDRT